ncbi:hypothetical protein NSQ77_18280 [Oceanobacillus sp. FSL K6-2867]|uniref:hypothetical protein n=1 Tax=Oceanobacillus sp. FSL K6-2867 TaxID=2954748 RepID=UPI0030DC8189
MRSKKLIVINVLTLIAFIFVVIIGINRIEATKDEYGKAEEKGVEQTDVIAEKETIKLVEPDAKVSVHTAAVFIKNNAGSQSLEKIALTMKNKQQMAEAADTEKIEEDLLEEEEEETSIIIDRSSPSASYTNNGTTDQTAEKKYKVEKKTNEEPIQKSDNGKTVNNAKGNHENKKEEDDDKEIKDGAEQPVNPPEKEEQPESPRAESDDEKEVDTSKEKEPIVPEEDANQPVKEPEPTPDSTKEIKEVLKE